MCGQAKYTLSFGRVKTIKYTTYVKMIGYESIHLNTVYVLSGREPLGENPMCVNIQVYLNKLECRGKVHLFQ